MLRFLLIISMVLSAPFSAAIGKSKSPKTTKELRDALFMQRGVYFAKSDSIDSETYKSTLTGLFKAQEDFSVTEGMVIVGDKFNFEPIIQVGPDGPEYSNDNLMAIGFDIEVDGSSEIEKTVNFLTSAPIENELSDFIYKNFVKSNKYIKEYGIDFYFTTLMTTMRKYPDLPNVISATVKAFEKYPDRRLLAYLRDYRTRYNIYGDTDQLLSDLIDTIITKVLLGEIFGPPPACESLPSMAKAIALSSEDDKIINDISKLGQLRCKEGVSYLFFIRHMGYLNKGENLFDNDHYFAWDKGNLRFSLDLQQREKYLSFILNSYVTNLSLNSISFPEALKMMAQKYGIICVGADSVYFDYLFKIPYRSDWELTKREFKNLVNNTLEASSSYYLKKVGKVHRIVKSRM